MTAEFKRLLMPSTYLDVILDQRLSWNDHIKHIANKATTVNAFLHISLYQFPPAVKIQHLQSHGQIYVCIMEYSLTVWDPRTSINMNHLESVQIENLQECVSGIILETLA